MRLKLSTALFVLAACSSGPSKQQPKKDPPTPPATKAVEKPEPKSEPKTEPAPATMASQPANAPMPATVVFVIDNQMAIPLACFDTTTKTILDAKDSDASCAKLMATNVPIKLSNSSSTKLKEKSEWTCEPAEFKKVAFSIEPQLPIDTMTELAVFPPATPVVFFPRVGENKFTATPDEAKLLTDAVKKSEPSAKKAPYVHQITKVDIDGDGKEDTIFSATVAGTGASDAAMTSIEGKFTFSGLFVRYGSKPEEFSLVQRQDYDIYEIRGAIDLNNDGRKELIISNTQWEGFGMIIYEVGADGALKALGDWGCGA